jgi:UDP-N-acetylglucosamine--N-acetylmuramyl-(pentapeptide) pyrophosphoryl-undecaprenol N-acetylglucosamine transferase
MIVAGGTGGHIMPGLALAEALLEKGREVVFVAGSRPIEKRILKDKPFSVYHLEVEGFVGRSLPKKIIALFKLGLAFLRSLQLVRHTKPQIIFAEGGYVSIPVVLAGKLLGKRLGLHEQNAIPGVANKLLSRLVDRVFISFPESKDYFPKDKVVFSGNFVRRSLFKKKEVEKEGVCLLILGGSLGARFINELSLEVLPRLLEEFPNLRVIWQTGLDDYERVKKKFNEEAFGGRVKILPFIDDMGSVYREADFVLSRAGASTIAELCALGIPALFIPFPYATHNHQEKNAKALVEADCAFMLKQSEATPERALSLLRFALSQKELRFKMGREMRKFFDPQGIERAIAEMEALVERR